MGHTRIKSNRISTWMKKIKGTPTIDAEKSSVQETFSLPEQYAHAAGLKKKESKRVDQKEWKIGFKNLPRKRRKSQNKKKKSKPAQYECESCVPESQEYTDSSPFP